jgi:hypothetical protein
MGQKGLNLDLTMLNVQEGFVREGKRKEEIKLLSKRFITTRILPTSSPPSIAVIVLRPHQ